MSDDMDSAQARQRFEQLLPFYVTKKLSAEDQAFVSTYIAANPKAKKALKFTEQLRRIVRNTGTNRNPDAALTRLLANFEPRKKLSLVKRLMAKLRALGISPPLAIALLVIVGQGIGYTTHKMNWFGRAEESVTAPAESHLSVTLKKGVDYAAFAVIIETYGGRIVHSSAANGVEKIFINVLEKARIQELIDALMSAGLIESVAILL